MLNKKIIILGIIIIVLIALGGGFAVYYKKALEAGKAIKEIGATSETEAPSETGAINATNEGSAIEEIPQIEVQAVSGEESGGGSLIICVDKCGDGVCQKTDSACERGNLNCVCLESPTDCPQDCK